jgi:hypothetical protein
MTMASQQHPMKWDFTARPRARVQPHPHGAPLGSRAIFIALRARMSTTAHAVISPPRHSQPGHDDDTVGLLHNWDDRARL